MNASQPRRYHGNVIGSSYQILSPLSQPLPPPLRTVMSFHQQNQPPPPPRSQPSMTLYPSPSSSISGASPGPVRSSPCLPSTVSTPGTALEPTSSYMADGDRDVGIPYSGGMLNSLESDESGYNETLQRSDQMDYNNFYVGDSFVAGNQLRDLRDGSESTYMDGQFRTTALGLPPPPNSWHQPVSPTSMYPPHQQLPFGASLRPGHLPAPSSSAMAGHYGNRMRPMMSGPSTVTSNRSMLPAPYYNNHQMGAPSTNYLPSGPSHGHHQPQIHSNRHYDTFGDLNNRRASLLGCPGGGHLRIMSTNLNSPENMLHMYPSNLANSTNGREARNKAEKNRRDKLNNAIHELSTMVPHVADSPRRVDKTAVLRLAAHGFRLNHIFKNTMGTTERSAITDSFLQMMNGFLITVTLRGQIVLVSSSLEQHLGHCQTDWYGQNILTYTHPDDHIFLKQQLIPVELENLFEIQPVLDSSGEQRARTPEEEELIDRKLREDRRDISIRLARAGPRSEPTVYEIVRLTGYFRRADLAPRGTKVTTFPGLHMIRRARTREESFLPLHTISGNDIVLVGIAHIVKPPKICDRLLEACKTEYKTRHLIDGRIVQCEQAISIVAGYMTDEVSGVSPFSFMHKDDVRWVMVALRQMYDYNKPFGESCYRLMSRTGKFIYMKTRGYLEIDKETNKVHSFVCINTLVSEEDGRRMVSEMKRKFSIIIGQEEVPESDNEEMLVENPMQIERAIMNLITNLESGTTGLPDPSPAPRDDVATRAIAASNGGKGADMRATQSPPLAIIAPKPSTIKSSVTKTMEVIKGSLAQSNKSDSLVSSDDEDDEDGGEVVQKGQSLWIRTVSESHNNSSSSSNNSGSSSGNTNKRSPSGDSGRQPEQKNCRPSVVHRTTSNKSMNLENRCSSSNSSSNSPSMAGGGVGTGSQQHHSPLMIKPEVMDSPMEGSTGHNLTFNSMYSDMANLPPAYAQESSQFLQIKQEVLSNDPLHSPASSTVSSLSYDQPASSSSSTVMGTGNTYTDVLIDDLGSDVGSCGSRRSLVAMKRSLGTSSSSLNQTTKRRRNSRSLDDIPDVCEQSPEFEIPATTTALIDSSEVAGADLIKELPTYFEAIDRSLDRIGNATDELRDQFLSIDNLSIAGTTCDNERDSVFESETTGVARSTDQLAKIVEEQIEQREILYSIKQEFGNQFHSVTSPDYRPGSSRLPQVLEASGVSLNTPKPNQAEPLYLSEEQQQELADSILYDDISFDTNSLKPG